jgi:hypothetical protein
MRDPLRLSPLGLISAELDRRPGLGCAFLSPLQCRAFASQDAFQKHMDMIQAEHSTMVAAIRERDP